MPSLLDDKLISLRLAGHPEFRVRLAEFLCAYGVVERPALVIQARPVGGNGHGRIDSDDPGQQSRFQAGLTAKDSWWGGFRSMVATRRTFHGIASLPSREDPHWASEVHRDGHFIAGIWKFPVLPGRDGSNVEVVPNFYVDIFVDFLRLIETMFQVESGRPTYETTWTLVDAPKLHYANNSLFGQFAINASPLKIPHLQSTVSTATVGTPEWQQLGIRMGQALIGAYGDAPQSRK